MTNAAPTITPANRPAMMGKCATCGSTLIHRGGQLLGHTGIRAPFPTISTVKPKSPTPLTAITGIGNAREVQLIRAGIDSIEKLAVASPAVVANAMMGVSIKNANHFINAARHLLETAFNHAGGLSRPDFFGETDAKEIFLFLPFASATARPDALACHGTKVCADNWVLLTSPITPNY